MLREFYDFIAKRINSYFQSISSLGTLLKGESFCLKLDDPEMVVEVEASLKELANRDGCIGNYNYQCMDGSIYSTFTLKLKNDEIIIAAQINGMTNDFLCATLRNAANEANKPILMISSNPIDSAKSGSRDMTASGMPFYSDSLVNEIRDMIFNSAQLTESEKAVLQFELKRRDDDVFSDRESLFEYKELLSIMSSGKVGKNDFAGFRLFSFDGKSDYQNYGKNQLEKELRQNHDIFERIERSIRFGNLETDLSEDFDIPFIGKIEKCKNIDASHWSLMFTYKDIQSAMEKKQAKKDNPLKIEREDIAVYSQIPLNSYSIDEKLFIRNEGTMTAKRRIRNLLIFNPDKNDSITVELGCNIKVPSSAISSDCDNVIKNGNNILFVYTESGLAFHKIEVKDEINKITYVFKICIIDINADYLISTIKTNFVIDYKKKNSRIKLLGIGTDLVFNKSGNENTSVKLEDNQQYRCNYSERLHIFSSEEELSNFGSGISIEVNFAGVIVPFIMFPDEVKSLEIIGRKILRDKFATRSSFEFIDSQQIYKDSQEYFAKENLLKELRLEQYIINNMIYYGVCKNYHNSNSISIKEQKLRLNSELKEAYENLITKYKELNTVPTLAYIDDKLLVYVKEYLEAFRKCFSGLTNMETLSREQEDALLLGTFIIDEEQNEIALTPFHPINLEYQLLLAGERGFNDTSDVIIERLNSANLLPYIQRKKVIYKVSEQMYSMEWKHYAPVENKKYMGRRRYVSKLIEEKISEYVAHFKYIFEDINNKIIKINLINMGDCSEVFHGIAQYYIHVINKVPDVDKLMKFEINIYTSNKIGNAFSNIKDYSRLKRYLSELKLSLLSGIAMSDLEGILSKNLSCYFHKDYGKNYEYAHISFYEMESEITSETATMDQIETGISLNGIISGIPSSKYGQKYRTGFGTKYANKSPLIQISELYNSLFQVSDSGNPYNVGISISTQVDAKAEDKMEYIYKTSNWVVFVEPKVDLDFFAEKEAKSDLLIIHYSDQYTSSSGYDAITVTHKSSQYSKVIQEYLKEKGVIANSLDVAAIINLFNAINGDWLLRLVSSKKYVGANKDANFSREKISIVAAIKYMLAYLKHPEILWIPVSMEEMLRVSGGAGLSQNEGVLSAKNLGFDKGATSDDLLFIGLQDMNGKIKVFLYPTEVKTGNNDNSVIKKAVEQVSKTAEGFHNAFNPEDGDNQSISAKVNRNFIMQLLIISSKKMKVYHVDDSQDWDQVLEYYRNRLLNEDYEISNELREILGKGSVLSFRKGLVTRTTSFKEDTINFIEMPEQDEFGLILSSVGNIFEVINQEERNFKLVSEYDTSALTGDMSKLMISEFMNDVGNLHSEQIEEENKQENDTDNLDKEELKIASIQHEEKVEHSGMEILFGHNQRDGKDVIWEPNNTDKIFHTNTGIIGTMGTGKTQFTQSLIAQLYRNRDYNIYSSDIGILIFDYKGDYNENKTDFMALTDAKIYKPYHLPFNPLALTWSGTPKPLLPVHTANTFVDTLAKVYSSLGPKQKSVLLSCIDSAYTRCGISRASSSTWSNEPPTFSTLYQIYASDDEIKKGDVLEAALQKIAMFEIFEPIASKTTGLFELLHGVVVIDLSGYDSDIQNLVVAITLDLFYSQMQSTGHSKLVNGMRQINKMILVDEADNFLRECYPSLRKILKEGREFGVGTILSTQFLKHFITKEEDYSKYILTWVVHNVADLSPSDVRFVFNTQNGSNAENQLCSDIKNLKKHESIVKIGNDDEHVYMKDRAFWQYVKDNLDMNS